MRGSATTKSGSRATQLDKLRADVEAMRSTLAELERVDPEIEPEDEQIAYSVPRAARVLDLSERTVWALIKSGEIASYTVGTARRISRTALEAYDAQKRESAA